MLSRRLLRIKVIKALYAHFKSDSESVSTSEKNLTASINRTYDLYHQMLRIVADVARYAENRIELGLNKKLPTAEDLNPNRRFIENAVIRQIEESRPLNDYLEKKSLGWTRYPEVIKNLYNDLIASNFYKLYMSAAVNNYTADVRLVEQFYTKIVEDNPFVEESVEEQSILWADDTGFSLIMVVRTLGDMRARQEDIPLLPQYKNEDDSIFAQELFRQTVDHYPDYMSYIEKFTRNWDVDRIAFVDNLIMVASMAELIGFPSIPVKVTLDEYIEIAKYYSTPDSSHFINGILDKISDTLTAENRIQKSGRGLL